MAQPALRLCLDPDNLPFSSRDAATPGYYVEAGRALADAIGRPFEPVWVPTYYTKRQIRQKLLAGQCDGFMGVPEDESFTNPRIVLTKPILSLGYALVAPKSDAIAAPADLHGRRVAVQFGTPPQNLLATENDVRTVTVMSPEEAMQDLKAGTADAAFVWGPSAAWVNHTALGDAYRIVPATGEHMQWQAAIAFPKTQADLRDQVDRVLPSLDQRMHTLAVKYGFPDAMTAARPSDATSAVATAPAPAEPSTPATPESAAQPNQPSAANQTDAASAGFAAAPATPENVAAGRSIFNQTCSHCHGPDAVQGEQRRNLRLLHARYGDKMPDMFIDTVTHGRVKKGMPNWSGIVSMDEFRKILAFLDSVQEPGS